MAFFILTTARTGANGSTRDERLLDQWLRMYAPQSNGKDGRKEDKEKKFRLLHERFLSRLGGGGDLSVAVAATEGGRSGELITCWTILSGLGDTVAEVIALEWGVAGSLAALPVHLAHAALPAALHAQLVEHLEYLQQARRIEKSTLVITAFSLQQKELAERLDFTFANPPQPCLLTAGSVEAVSEAVPEAAPGMVSLVSQLNAHYNMAGRLTETRVQNRRSVPQARLQGALATFTLLRNGYGYTAE